MSMSYREAIEHLEDLQWNCSHEFEWDALEMAIAALEEKERNENLFSLKDWKSEWKEYTGADAGFHYCFKCGQQAFNYEESGEVIEVLSDFCPSCARAMTPEALKELEKRFKG